MIEHIKKHLLRGAAYVVLALSCGSALAVPTTFTFEGTGTGTAGAAAFANAAFTIQVFAETDDNVLNGNIFITAFSPSSIDIAGIGAGMFTSGKLVFNNMNNNVLGLNNAVASDLIDLGPDAAFAGYALDTDFGPVFDPSPFAFSQFVNIGSTLGDITFTNIVDVTFSAAVTTVSEPATLALLALGLAGVGFTRRKKKV